jgi:transcriptional regulator with XRE-family HTH domain
MLGDEIRKARQQKNLTQEQLSLATGVDRAYLSEIENGLRSPSVEVFMRLCTALGESAGVVLGRVEGIDLLPGNMKGLAKLVYDENGVLTKIIDDRGRELVADFNWVEPGERSTSRASPATKRKKKSRR